MEKNLKKKMYNWITLLYTWNIINQLYLNKKTKTNFSILIISINIFSALHLLAS